MRRLNYYHETEDLKTGYLGVLLALGIVFFFFLLRVAIIAGIVGGVIYLILKMTGVVG